MTEETMTVELTRDEAEWLRVAANMASENAIVPGAAEELVALADKLEWLS